jgi:RNA polymerase sigma-70 factor (ECF subfamily)
MPEPALHERELDDTDLVRAVQQGDIDYFEPLVDRHLAAVRTFLSLKVPVPQLVDELAHDTFLFAFRHLHEFGPGTSFRNWLRAIAWNLLRAEVLRYSRRQIHADRLRDQWLIDSSVADGACQPDAEYLEQCFETLPEHSRNLLNLHYRDGFDSREIATRLARSRAWVRTTLFRLRHDLKSCIEGKRSAARA